MPMSVYIAETNQLVGPFLTVDELLKRMIKLGPDVVQAGLRVEVEGRQATHPRGKEPDVVSKPLWSALAFNHTKASQAVALKDLESYRDSRRAEAAADAAAQAEEEKTQLERLARLLVSDVDDPETVSWCSDVGVTIRATKQPVFVLPYAAVLSHTNPMDDTLSPTRSPPHPPLELIHLPT